MALALTASESRADFFASANSDSSDATFALSDASRAEVSAGEDAPGFDRVGVASGWSGSSPSPNAKAAPKAATPPTAAAPAAAIELRSSSPLSSTSASASAERPPSNDVSLSWSSTSVLEKTSVDDFRSNSPPGPTTFPSTTSPDGLKVDLFTGLLATEVSLSASSTSVWENTSSPSRVDTFGVSTASVISTDAPGSAASASTISSSSSAKTNASSESISATSSSLPKTKESSASASTISFSSKTKAPSSASPSATASTTGEASLSETASSSSVSSTTFLSRDLPRLRSQNQSKANNKSSTRIKPNQPASLLDNCGV